MPTIALTAKELAERERVTRRTVYRWIDKGAFLHTKTEGGRLRIIAPERQPSFKTPPK